LVDTRGNELVEIRNDWTQSERKNWWNRARTQARDRKRLFLEKIAGGKNGTGM